MAYLNIFYLLFPVFAANMAPQIASRLGILKSFDRPVDFGKSVFGKRIFGENKTLRGFIVGVGFSIVIAFLQYILDFQGIVKIEKLSGLGQFLLFGFLAGFGALLGDLIESFFKRQLGIKAGRPFVPFDQIDYIIGFLFFTSIVVEWGWKEIVFAILCGLFLNPIVNFLAYILKVKKTYW
jgi:CDP-2,3-bis-(O-geranylgeranyl)-sn-glycerol synthase